MTFSATLNGRKKNEDFNLRRGIYARHFLIARPADFPLRGFDLPPNRTARASQGTSNDLINMVNRILSRSKNKISIDLGRA